MDYREKYCGLCWETYYFKTIPVIVGSARFDKVRVFSDSQKQSLVGLQLKKRLWHWCFHASFAKISKNTFSYRTIPLAASRQCFVVVGSKVFGKPLAYFTLTEKAYNFIKKGSGTGVFLWILQNFLEHLLYRTPPGDCLLPNYSFWTFELKNIVLYKR